MVPFYWVFLAFFAGMAHEAWFWVIRLDVNMHDYLDEQGQPLNKKSLWNMLVETHKARRQ